MKNSELWAQYSDYTEQFSTFSRQLAFAAVAVCWLFKTPELSFPRDILVSLIFVVAFFTADVLQFFTSAHLLRWWTRREETRKWEETKTIEGEYDKPWYLDTPAFVFFNVKAICLVVAFLFIAFEFWSRINLNPGDAG